MASTDENTASTSAALDGQITSSSDQEVAPPQMGGATKNKFKQISLPNAEQMMMEEIMNNCFVKTGVSSVMGGLAGVAFGLFSASMENAHGVSAI